MRIIWSIARNDLIKTLRDRQGLLLFLVMPLVLITILGNALEGMMGTDVRMEPFTVAVANADEAVPPLPALGQILVDEVFGSEEVGRLLQVVEAPNAEAAVTVNIPAEYSARSFMGEVVPIEVIGDPERPLAQEIVTSIVTSFSDQVVAGVLAGRLQVEGFTPGVAVDLIEQPSGARWVGAAPFYTVSMSLMFMLMTAINRAGELIRQREEGLTARILTSPVTPAQVVAGWLVATVIIAVVQFTILVLGAQLIFGMRLDPLGPIFALGLAFSISAAGLGALGAGLFPNAQAADSAVGIVGNLATMLSGGMFPLYFFPPLLQAVAKFTPNYWGFQGMLDQLAGMGPAYLWTPLLVLLGLGLLTGSVGAWRLAASRKGAM